jgi:uncharacterized protein
MHVAITGSSGLIGRALTHSLLHDGHTVLRLVRDETKGPDTSSSPESPGSPVRFLLWDPERGKIDAAGLEGVDAAVHLAGAGVGDRRWTDARKRLIKNSRATGTATLATALAQLERRPQVLVSASGVHYYGDRGDEVLTETSETGGGFLAEVTRAWEAGTEPAANAGIRTVVARNGVVLSTDGGPLPKLLPLFRFGIGGRMGSGHQWFSWISMADEIRAIRFLLEPPPGTDPVSGPVNMTAPQPVTNRQLTKALGRALHRPALMPIPKFGPRLVVGREMADEMLFMSQRAQPAVLQSAGYVHQHPDIDTALDAVLHPPQEPEQPDKAKEQ